MSLDIKRVKQNEGHAHTLSTLLTSDLLSFPQMISLLDEMTSNMITDVPLVEQLAIIGISLAYTAEPPTRSPAGSRVSLNQPFYDVSHLTVNMILRVISDLRSLRSILLASKSMGIDIGKDVEKKLVHYRPFLLEKAEEFYNASVGLHKALISHYSSSRSTLAFLFGKDKENDMVRICKKQVETAYEGFEFRRSWMMLDETISLISRKLTQLDDEDGHVFQDGDLVKTSTEEFNIALGEDSNRSRSFWDGTTTALVSFNNAKRPALVKNYVGKSMTAFNLDLKFMMEHRHANFPQLIGVTGEGTQVPSIIVNLGSILPLENYLALLADGPSNTAIHSTWNTVIALRKAAEYLIKEQVVTGPYQFSEMIEDLVVDEHGKVIIAPNNQDLDEGGRWYGGTRKPDEDIYDGCNLSIVSRLEDFLIYNGPRSLRLIGNVLCMHDKRDQLLYADRRALDNTSGYTSYMTSLMTRRESYSWLRVTELQQEVPGDLGYFKRPSTQDDSTNTESGVQFVKLGNIREQIGELETTHYARNDSTYGAHRLIHPCERISSCIWQSPLPLMSPTSAGNVLSSEEDIEYHWDVSLDHEGSWAFLISNAKRLGDIFDVPPEELVLVTQVGFDVFAFADMSSEVPSDYKHGYHPRINARFDPITGDLESVAWLMTSSSGSIFGEDSENPEDVGNSSEMGLTPGFAVSDYINRIQRYIQIERHDIS